MPTVTIYREIAQRLNAMRNAAEAKAIRHDNVPWSDIHGEHIDLAMKKAPNGAGFNSGIEFMEEDSTPERLVFEFAFQHIYEDDNTNINYWTNHTAIVTGSLQFGIDIDVQGQDMGDESDYIVTCLYSWLNGQIEV